MTLLFIELGVERVLSRQGAATKWSLIVASLLATGGAVGCGAKSEDVAVTGRVSFQEKPIGNGSLTFFPVEGRPVTATLSSDGVYTCRLPPGEYRVAVTVGIGSLPQGWKEGDPVPPPAIELPVKYATRVKTPLSASVAPDQSAPIDFALK